MKFVTWKSRFFWRINLHKSNIKILMRINFCKRYYFYAPENLLIYVLLVKVLLVKVFSFVLRTEKSEIIFVKSSIM